MFAIETKNLTKSYGKARGIIDVSLQVEPGEIYGFIGPNGAGKSTAIRTLLNLIYPTKGEAQILGYDVVKESKKIKQQIGYLPSEVNYYDDLKVRELFDYSARFYGGDHSQRIKELIDIFEVDPGKQLDALSLGNKKKTAIIQALLHRPKVLILDEPTSGLDPLMQKHFFDVLKEENSRGTTIFFSSHVLDEVQKLCHRVAIIKEGRILKVEEIQKLRATQFKKVQVIFKDGAAFNWSEIPGIINYKRENGHDQFLFNGKVDELVRKLATAELENLWLEEPSLEEVFLHYYEKEGAQ